MGMHRMAYVWGVLLCPSCRAVPVLLAVSVTILTWQHVDWVCILTLAGCSNHPRDGLTSCNCVNSVPGKVGEGIGHRLGKGGGVSDITKYTYQCQLFGDFVKLNMVLTHACVSNII